ncbi:MAG: hypothetical protein ACJ788_17485 [Ktedonobacteraceae bacterium]
MRMEEPEQRQRLGQEWQASQEFGEYSAEYPGRDESEQQEYIEVVARDDSQQKIYPQRAWSPRGKMPGILAIVLSSIGFFIAVGGIVVSAIVLKYAHGQQEWLAGGVIGLVGSIVVMLVCIAIFVTAVVMLSLRGRRGRRWTGTRV